MKRNSLKPLEIEEAEKIIEILYGEKVEIDQDTVSYDLAKFIIFDTTFISALIANILSGGLFGILSGIFGLLAYGWREENRVRNALVSKISDWSRALLSSRTEKVNKISTLIINKARLKGIQIEGDITYSEAFNFHIDPRD